MNYFSNLFLQILSILPIFLFFIGIFLSFFGYKIINIAFLIFAVIIGFITGSIIGILEFHSNTMAFIFGVILSITFSFFISVYYKYLKHIFIAILSILFFIYLPFFILFEIIPINLFQIKLYIFISLIFVIISIILNCIFTKITTIIITSITGSIMFFYTIFYKIFHVNNNLILKFISFLFLSIIGILIQLYMLKNDASKK